ncbi:helix-turn-helix domain-containing protein [Epibacterium sp. MM17-32]|uniref:helix-turn-helix domain-containing protein n=1 Tax=Epibacterium sp. MM17-32 TaxID=2917734 RepID=UPI001EF3D9D4|nr:helix-turn-helix domain-containing protein [Epibacterium sp. MM17-32]MCG7630168.1 helix-turn-helix domain-containing protein [Epibacterium sp. MM17-32]
MPRPAKNLKLEERIEVARRFAAGESAKELAAVFGISARHVNRLAKEEAGEGITVRDPSEAVAFRASRSELDAFDAEWRERGYASRSQALNAVLRGRCGFLDVPRDLVAEFCAAWRQAKDVSDAGLALAKAVHRGRLEVSEADRAVLIELLDLAQSMSREMGRMKDAAQALRLQEWPQKEEGQGAESAVLEDDLRTLERGGLRLVRNG